MSSNPPDPRDSRPAEPSPSDLAESAVRKIVTAIVIAAAIVALAIYSRPAPPRFQAIMADGRIVRIDTKTGTVLACEENRCMTIVRRGQHLERRLSHAPSPKQDVQPSQALPARQEQVAPPTQ